MRVGLREANQHFSRVVRAVKSGQQVVLTERGKPIAVVKPLPDAPAIDEALRRLEAAGLLRVGSKRGPMPPWRPRSLKGVPLSTTIREDRDSS